MVSSISINDLPRFNYLGALINDNFEKLYNLNTLISSDYDYLYGYYINDVLIAFIHFNKMYENVDIVNIVVDVEHRNKGIASKLLDFSFHLFDDVESIMLEVNENNINAISLYKKYDFEVINIRKKYYGEDNALIMKRVVENEKC